jgi:hypothetical protein
MFSIDISDLDWNLFENKFGISRNDVVKVKNRFRSQCVIYVHKNNLQNWTHMLENSNSSGSIPYYIMSSHDHTWYENVWEK